MALNQLCKGDVQTGGLDTNGGFFHTGATGTDYSQQTTPQYSVTDGVTAGTTTITSATAAFGTDVVGNGIYVQGGTGSVAAGWYEIISRTNSTTIVVDRSTGLSVGTGATLHIGGCWLTIQQGINAMFTTATGYAGVSDAVLYVKKGTYASTVALVTTNSVGASNYFNRVYGYNTTHGDNPLPGSGNQPVYAVGSGAGVNGLTVSTSGFFFRFITFDGTATSGTKGTKGVQNTGAAYFQMANCKIMNFSQEGLIGGGTNAGTSFCFNEITGCAGTTAVVTITTTAFNFSYNWIHLCTQTAFSSGPSVGSTIIGNLITNISGATSDGIQFGYGININGNTIYGIGRDGIRGNAGAGYNTTINTLIVNNIIAKCVGNGINPVVAAPTPADVYNVNYNAFYSNGANYANINAGANDVSVSINPFVSSDANLASETSPNWGLNNTASAGASFRAAGYPGLMPGLSTSTGYRDLGLFQHQDSGGGGTTYNGFFAT